MNAALADGRPPGLGDGQPGFQRSDRMFSTLGTVTFASLLLGDLTEMMTLFCGREKLYNLRHDAVHATTTKGRCYRKRFRITKSNNEHKDTHMNYNSSAFNEAVADLMDLERLAKSKRRVEQTIPGNERR